VVGVFEGTWVIKIVKFMYNNVNHNKHKIMVILFVRLNKLLIVLAIIKYSIIKLIIPNSLTIHLNRIMLGNWYRYSYNKTKSYSKYGKNNYPRINNKSSSTLLCTVIILFAIIIVTKYYQPVTSYYLHIIQQFYLLLYLTHFQ
jgi:hypothetical protein